MIAHQSVDRILEFVSMLLQDKTPPRRRESGGLSHGRYVTHDTSIVRAVLRELSLKVVEGIPDEVCGLFRTYEFGDCARPHGAAYQDMIL